MQFLLANPAWLWLLLLGAVPILVHFFARSNPPKFAFSSVEFLQRVIKKTARLRKPHDWLMLLLRTLAILALLFVFLQPLLTSEHEITGDKNTTIFVIDRSASMLVKEGGSDRFALACQKATELLKSGSIDEANVIWMDGMPDAAFPQPGPNIDYLRDLLARAQVHQEPGSVATAIQMALTQLELARGSRELVIISDFQSTAWKDFTLESPPGIKVVKVQTGESLTENLAIQSLSVNPSEPVTGQDVAIVSRVRNFSGTPRRTTLFLESDGARQSKEVNIPAWGEAEVSFQTRFARAGQLSITARIEGDDYPGDDQRHAIIQVRDTLRLVSVQPPTNSGRTDGVQVLSRLAASLDWLEHRTVTTDNLTTIGGADYLFLHQWDGQDIDTLKSLAENQTSLFVYPAPGVKHETLSSLISETESKETGIVQIESSPSGKSLKAAISPLANTDAPLFSLFRSGEFGNPAEGVFKTRFRMAKDWPDDTARLIDYRDGVPGILKAPNLPMILWNLPLSSQHSTWPGQSTFLPFMGELLLHSRSKRPTILTEVLPGSPISWIPHDGISPESLSLTSPKGNTLETELRMGKLGAQLVSQADASPGIYQWKVGEGIVHQQSANFPDTESDLRVISPSDVAGGEVVDPSKLLRRAALGDGVPLWPWFVAAGPSLSSQ